MKRAEILKAAENCVCGGREHDHGTPENNFGTIGRFWSVYLSAAHPGILPEPNEDMISAKDVSVMMALLKIARIATGSSPDSYVDLAGYAACAGELAENKENGT